MNNILGNEKQAALAKSVEQATEARIEKHFRSHPELPNGRDFRFNRTRDIEADRKYHQKFDSIFPNAPGAGF